MLGLNSLKGVKPQQLARLACVGSSADLLGLRFFAAAPNNLALIKQLREQTGAPIADVKSALQQADWDLGMFSFSVQSTFKAMMSFSKAHLVDFKLNNQRRGGSKYNSWLFLFLTCIFSFFCRESFSRITQKRPRCSK